MLGCYLPTSPQSSVDINAMVRHVFSHAGLCLVKYVVVIPLVEKTAH